MLLEPSKARRNDGLRCTRREIGVARLDRNRFTEGESTPSRWVHPPRRETTSARNCLLRESILGDDPVLKRCSLTIM